MEQMAIDIFTDVMKTAVPVAVAFEIGNLIVSSFLRAAFGGRLWFGR